MTVRWFLRICFTVMALLASASVSSAASCSDDPNECTLKKLCEASTTLDGSNTIWATASETAKHVAVAQSLGMECGVTPIVDLCEKDPSECKVSEICERATTESAGQKTWDDSAAGHVALAKEYGLSCDVVVEAETEAQGVCTVSNLAACNAKILCVNSTYYKGTTKAWSMGYRLPYVKEAKKRGLSCGVGEAKAAKAKTPSSIVLEASKRVCPGNGIGHNCTGVYTDKDGDKWIGRRVNRNLYGVATLLLLAGNQWKGYVQIGQRDHISDTWSGQSLSVWPSGNARFDFDVPQQSFQSNSTVNKVFPELRRMFNALPKQQRLEIQRSLVKKDLYASTIDGAWGRNTLIGLSRFAAEHLNTINLKSKSNIRLVLDGLIAQASLTRTKMASLSILEDVAEKDAGFTRVASNSSSMKNAYIGESALRRKQIQYALKKLGFYTSGVDGLWGNGTASALVSYQNEEGLQSSTPSQVFRGILSKVDVPSSFAAITPTQKACSASNPKVCTNAIVCNRANWGSTTVQVWIKEGKRRGLTCGVIPQANTTKSDTAGSTTNDTAGLTAIISNPTMTGAQALAICRPQAELAKSQARSQAESMGSGGRRTYDLDCSFGSCRARDVTPSGGAWGGIARGLGISKAGKRAYSAVLEACLAGYGWR